MNHSTFRLASSAFFLMMGTVVFVFPAVGCRETYQVNCLETPNDDLCHESCSRHPEQDWCNDCALYPERTHCGDASIADGGMDGAVPEDGGRGDGGSLDGGPVDGGLDGGPCGACPRERPHCDSGSASCVACLSEDHCGGSTPACDRSTGLCVGCLSSSDCGGETPVCDTDSQVCVGCLSDGDCGGETAHCDLGGHVCVACLEADHCDSAAPVCDSGACTGCSSSEQCTAHTPSSGAGLNHCDAMEGSCEACTEHGHCLAAGASQCGADSTCVPCSTDAHCAGNAAGNVCDGGSCVQCNAADESACGSNVCDLATGRCTMTPAGESGLCQECVSDRQCMDGQGCVPMAFDGTMVGNFCLWRRDSMEPLGPQGNCVGVRAYVREAMTTTLSGVEDFYCHPRRTTCEGLRDFSAQSCTTPGADDGTCGVSGVDDGLCRSQGGFTRCTYECVSDDDCSGTTCNLGASPRYCNFI